MKTDSQQQNSNQVVRISLLWLFTGTLAVLLLGIAGGIIANQIWPPVAQIPLTNEGDKFITTVKEVKISPNQAAEEVVNTANRSIVGINAKNNTKNTLATGIVITNDGLIVTTANLPNVELNAKDWQGRELPLNLVGTDEMFGLTYLRVEEGVLSPIDIRSNNIPPGNELILLSRTETNGLVRTDKFTVNEWMLPPEISPAGIQRLLKGSYAVDKLLPGAIILDEETKMSGIVLNKQVGLVIPADHILASMQRLADNKREVNPFQELGINVHFNLADIKQEGRAFVTQIVSVQPDSWAEKAELQRNDQIISIDGQKLNWQEMFINKINQDSIKEITVIRNDEEQTIEIKQTN